MKATFASLIIAAAVLENVAAQSRVSPSAPDSTEFAKLTSFNSEPGTQPQFKGELGLNKDTQVELTNEKFNATPYSEDVEYADKSSAVSDENIYPDPEDELDDDKLAKSEEELMPSAKVGFDEEYPASENKFDNSTLSSSEENDEKDKVSGLEDKNILVDDDNDELADDDKDDGDNDELADDDKDDGDNDELADDDKDDDRDYDRDDVKDDDNDDEKLTLDLKPYANYTTSTVYSTVTSTVTDCATTVTYCPEIGSVVTKTISLYTTVCPVTTTSESIPLVTAPAVPRLPEVSYLTKTIESTIWYTVTDCSSDEIDCTIGQKTSSVATYYDVHPITGIFTQTADYEGPIPTTTPFTPFTTDSPSGNPFEPENNVKMPIVPIITNYNAASTHKGDGFLMYIGLAFAATAALVSQGWF